MKKLTVFLLLLPALPAFTQTAEQLIQRVFEAQKKITNLAYRMDRTDTLVTGHVRSMQGEVKMSPYQADTLWGFKFFATKDGESGQRIYDGHMAYSVDTNGTYTSAASPGGIRAAVYSGGGGHLILPDIIRLDTSNAIAMEVTSDQKSYFLKLTYADYKPEDVTKRYKLLTIDKALMLPLAMRNHQESYGKVQDLSYRITSLKINHPEEEYDFANLSFLNTHRLRQPVNAAPMPIYALLDKPAPPIELESFKGTRQKVDFKGKVTLIDLWEVWCGPCIAAMPKVEKLRERYESRGLQIFGITSDPRALDAGKTMVKKRAVNIPMLIGDEQFRKSYHSGTTALPMYILIDRRGNVLSLWPGFNEEMENGISNLLGD